MDRESLDLPPPPLIQALILLSGTDKSSSGQESDDDQAMAEEDGAWTWLSDTDLYAIGLFTPRQAFRDPVFVDSVHDAIMNGRRVRTEYIFVMSSCMGDDMFSSSSYNMYMGREVVYGQWIERLVSSTFDTLGFPDADAQARLYSALRVVVMEHLPQANQAGVLNMVLEAMTVPRWRHNSPKADRARIAEKELLAGSLRPLDLIETLVDYASSGPRVDSVRRLVYPRPVGARTSENRDRYPILLSAALTLDLWIVHTIYHALTPEQREQKTSDGKSAVEVLDVLKEDVRQWASPEVLARIEDVRYMAEFGQAPEAPPDEDACDIMPEARPGRPLIPRAFQRFMSRDEVGLSRTLAEYRRRTTAAVPAETADHASVPLG